VGDIAESVGKEQGGWYEPAKEACVVNGKWKAVPFGNVGQLMNWRMDWFKEVGFDKFPDTWDRFNDRLGGVRWAADYSLEFRRERCAKRTHRERFSRRSLDSSGRKPSRQTYIQIAVDRGTSFWQALSTNAIACKTPLL